MCLSFFGWLGFYSFKKWPKTLTGHVSARKDHGPIDAFLLSTCTLFLGYKDPNSSPRLTCGPVLKAVFVCSAFPTRLCSEGGDVKRQLYLGAWWPLGSFACPRQSRLTEAPHSWQNRHHSTGAGCTGCALQKGEAQRRSEFWERNWCGDRRTQNCSGAQPLP